jgi:pimeloyl-ACP methyl ester carboxylesterase
MRTLQLLTLASFAAAATVDGVQIHSSTHGSGPKTLIFVHGWTCDESSWAEQVPAFQKEYRVITLDLPGHGQSGAPKDALSMALFARAIEAVRAEARVDKVVLIGHSMGVPVIRQYARMFPAHVAGLVPVDGPLHLSGGPNAPNPDAMKGSAGMKNREAMIRTMFGPSATPAMKDQVLKMMLAPPESTASQAMAAMFNPAIWIEDVMQFPVLGIYAEKSGANDPTFMKKVFPKGSAVEIAGTGHFVMMEKPAEFNRLLAGFLAKVKF